MTCTPIAGHLRQRDTHLGVQLDDECDDARAELHRGGAECIGGLETVAALHAAPTLRTVADLDVEATHEGAHLGEVFLMLRGHAWHFDGAAAVGARPWRRRRIGLIDPRRARAASLGSVLCAGSPPRAPAAPLRPVLPEGGGLASTRPPGVVELLLEVFTPALPPVSVAGRARQVTVGARQVLVQLGVLPLEFLNALVPRILLSPRSLRTAPSAALAGHAPRIGTCAPRLHTTSRILAFTR